MLKVTKSMLEVIGVPCEVQTLTDGAANETRVTISFGDLVVLATGLDPARDPQTMRGHCVQLKAHLGPCGQWISHGPILLIAASRASDGVTESSAQHRAPVSSGDAPAQTQASAHDVRHDAGHEAHPVRHPEARAEGPPATPAPAVRTAPRNARPALGSPFAALVSGARAPAPSGASSGTQSGAQSGTPSRAPAPEAHSQPTSPSQATRVSATLTPLRPATRSPASGSTPASPAPAGRSPYGAAPDHKRFDPNAPDSDLDDVSF